MSEMRVMNCWRRGQAYSVYKGSTEYGVPADNRRI